MTEEHCTPLQTAANSLFHSAEAILHTVGHSQTTWAAKIAQPAGQALGIYEVSKGIFSLVVAVRLKEWDNVDASIQKIALAATNAGSFGALGLVEALFNSAMEIKRIDGGDAPTFEQALNNGLLIFQEKLADIAFKYEHPEAVPDVKVASAAHSTASPSSKTYERLFEKLDYGTADATKPDPTIIILDPIVVTRLAPANSLPAGDNTPPSLQVLAIPFFDRMNISVEESLGNVPYERMDISVFESLEISAPTSPADTSGNLGSDALQISLADQSAFVVDASIAHSDAFEGSSSYMAGDMGISAHAEYGVSHADDNFGSCTGYVGLSGDDFPVFDSAFAAGGVNNQE